MQHVAGNAALWPRAVTADAGKTAFEELAGALSEPLIEFVATNRPSARDRVQGDDQHRQGRAASAGTAAAAVYFEKPLEQVTAAEARAVLEQVAGEGDDRDRVWSAWRAALRQAVFYWSR